MSMLPAAIEDTDARVTAVAAALAAALPDRVVARGFVPFTERDSAQLAKGVLNVITAGEGDYATGRGMQVREGTTNLRLIGHIDVTEQATSLALEQAELAFIAEIKDFFRQDNVAGLSLRLDNWVKSQLTERPHGWFVVYADIGPPRANTH